MPKHAVSRASRALSQEAGHELVPLHSEPDTTLV